ncbi:MAG: SMP-30/gluconolactonase/LRE family protein [Terriglobia bacterium]
MKKLLIVLCVITTVSCAHQRQSAPAQYKLGRDSQRQPGVPRGTVTHYTWNTSTIFPGTVRDYWVYVPAEYDSKNPACVMVFQDGGGFVRENGAARVPIVFDNLIHAHEMPVTIGIFINPGVLPAPSARQRARYNRSFEYDSLGDRYARFLLDEILPQVSKRYNLSTNPNAHAIAGSSSGGICAFTVAWTHPEAFRRVLSFVGSFTDLRGGGVYPALIRKTEPKPLRVFLQDGTKDLNIYAGDWLLGAQSMASALEYAGYDVKLVIGSEDHNMKQGGAILPDALRWLWRDYPKPVEQPHASGDRQFSTRISDADHGWELVSEGYKVAAGLAASARGDVYFSDERGGRIFKLQPDGPVSVFAQNAGGVSGLAVGADGRLYACERARKRIVAYTPDGKERAVASNVPCSDLAPAQSGAIYFTDPAGGRVWYIGPRGAKRVAWQGIDAPAGVQLSPGQSLLFVDQADGSRIWSFQIQRGGSLANGEPFYGLETAGEDDHASAAGMAVDSDGFLYVDTGLGVQICDQPGRVVAILNKPAPGPLRDITFGGPDFQDLYVTAGDQLFRRRLRRKGVPPGSVLQPPVPHL